MAHLAKGNWTALGYHRRRHWASGSGVDTDLGTRFAEIVVTDDQGRYVIPDLPQATYSVWVHSYGLGSGARAARL